MRLTTLKILALVFVVGLAAVFGTRAFGDEYIVEYIPPTEYTDDTPLDPLTELERYQFGCGSMPGTYTDLSREWLASAAINNRRPVDFPPGTYFCALRVKCIGVDCLDYSDWSNEVNFTIGRRPKPPQVVAVTAVE